MRLALYLVCVFCSSGLPTARSQDWPGILGPARDGTTTAPELQPEAWPPRLTPDWKVAFGSGFAGPAVFESRVLVAHRTGNLERLSAIELQSGKPIWDSDWKATYKGTINPDNGPRCVPVVAGNRAICYGAAGELACLNLATGKRIWLRSLRQDYDADDGYFGAGSTPLIVEDLVVVCPGGKKAGIIAVELDTGKTRWTATSYEASYASPIQLQRGTETLLLVVTRLRTVLLNARDGSLLSEVSFGSRGPTVNAATPIAVNASDYLLTASYGVGTLVLGIEGIQIVERFRDQNLLSSQYNTPVRAANRIVGINGREDAGVASLRAIDVQHRTVLWEQPEFGMAHLIGLGEHVLALSLDGVLTLIDASADEFRPLARSQLPAGTYRGLPALVGNLLILRANHSSTQSEVMCFRLP